MSSLATLALFGLVFLCERRWPLRPDVIPARTTLSEGLNVVISLAVNSGRLALMSWFVLAVLVPFLRRHHLPVPIQPLVGLPVAIQFVVHFVVADFLNYAVHRLLHVVKPLWFFHRVHHSVQAGEMRGLVAFRFHMGDVIVFASLQLIPLLFVAVEPRVAFAVGIVQSAIGIAAHANLDVGHGVIGRLLVTPAFHRWHHAHDDESPAGNFGSCLSIWDWLAGTASLPARPPARLGHSGDDEIIDNVFGHQLWPLVRRRRR